MTMSTDQTNLNTASNMSSNSTVHTENGPTNTAIDVSQPSGNLVTKPTNGTGSVVVTEQLSNIQPAVTINGNVQLGASAMANLAKIVAEQKPLVSNVSSQSTTATPEGSQSNGKVMVDNKPLQNAPSVSAPVPISAQPAVTTATQIVMASVAAPSTIQQPVLPSGGTTTVQLPQPATASPQQILIPRNATTISLPRGIALPPGTVLMQNDKGQLVFVSRAPVPQNLDPKPGMVSEASLNRSGPHIIPQQRLASAVNMSGPRFHPQLSQPQPHAVNPHGMRVDKQHGFFPPQPSILPDGSAAPQAIRPGIIGQQTTQVLVRPANATNSPIRVQVPTSIAQKPIMPSSSAADRNRDEIRKCKNFLETLIRLSSQQPVEVLNNVKNLIKGLLDGSVSPDTFTTRLQKELKSQKQPGLTAFLRKSLPELREALRRNELSIDGLGTNGQIELAVSSATPPVIQVPSNMVRPGTKLTHQQINVLQRQQQLQAVQNLQRAALPAQIRPLTTASVVLPTTVTALQVNQRDSGSPAPKGKQRLDLGDDADLNDVATMGGVNLSEESRNILGGSAEAPGQLRSCKDEFFLDNMPLTKRIKSLAMKKGLRDVSSDVIGLISHSCQERLRCLVEKSTLAAEHRLEIYKVDQRFEASSDVRAQLKFLEELDKLEKKRHDDMERETLLRAAKSRSKHEDPEQAKLKQKAKEMQQQELEEVRQREANLTALAAIGPRKKRKLDDLSTTSSGSSASGNSLNPSSQQAFHRPRLKRVSLRDLIFVLEQDDQSSKSATLYKSFLK